jgi:hypothetical protein
MRFLRKSLFLAHDSKISVFSSKMTTFGIFSIGIEIQTCQFSILSLAQWSAEGWCNMQAIEMPDSGPGAKAIHCAGITRHSLSRHSPPHFGTLIIISE